MVAAQMIRSFSPSAPAPSVGPLGPGKMAPVPSLQTVALVQDAIASLSHPSSPMVFPDPAALQNAAAQYQMLLQAMAYQMAGRMLQAQSSTQNQWPSTYPDVPTSPVSPVSPVSSPVSPLSPVHRLSPTFPYDPLTKVETMSPVMQAPGHMTWPQAKPHLQPKAHCTVPRRQDTEQTKTQEREQRTVVVKGLPKDVPVCLIQNLFNSFGFAPEMIRFVSAERHGEAQQKSSDAEEFNLPAWHVTLKDVDEARQAAKMTSIQCEGYEVEFVLAVQPHRCDICNMTVNSEIQLQQHVAGSRHKELLKQYMAHCRLAAVNVPVDLTETQIRQLFEGCEIPEGNITMEHDAANSSFQAVSIIFASKGDADRAFEAFHAMPTMLGDNVRILRRRNPPPAQRVEVPKTGLKTATEGQQLVRSLLYSHHITDASEVSPQLFGRIYSTFLSCKPYPLPGVEPRDRFFQDFDRQVAPGSSKRRISLANTLTILKQMDQGWPFELPLGVTVWMQGKLAKYCHDPDTYLLSKATFVQIRNMKWAAYQVVQQITQLILENQAKPPALLHPMQPVLSPVQSECSGVPSSPITEDDFSVDDQPWDDESLDVQWA